MLIIIFRRHRIDLFVFVSFSDIYPIFFWKRRRTLKIDLTGIVV